jgi:SET domain-containing protein
MSKPRVTVTETGRKVMRKRSKISGWGVYACEPINKNSRILEYAGEKISAAESDRREQLYQAKGHIWCFTLSRRFARDGSVGGNVARYINHSCTPNCYSEVVKHHTVWIRAARNIRKGEELTYNYFTEGEAGMTCRCRPGCKGQI